MNCFIFVHHHSAPKYLRAKKIILGNIRSLKAFIFQIFLCLEHFRSRMVKLCACFVVFVKFCSGT